MATPEPERIRWVRYAADCAERVLSLTGPARPQAEAAIRAARAWADDPTEERCCQVAEHAADAAVHASSAADHAAYVAAYHATHAAAYAADAAAYAAVHASSAADCAANAAADHDVEQAWQAKRRRFYGLPED